MWPEGVPAFGSQMRREFLVGSANGTDEDVVFCNHGSYGAVPRKVMEERYYSFQITPRHFIPGHIQGLGNQLPVNFICYCCLLHQVKATLDRS